MSFLTESFLEGMKKEQEEEILALLTKEFKEMFPTRCRVLGEKNLKFFTEHCQAKAKYYEYEKYIDLKRYAIVAFFLGTYFEEDRLYPWVENIFKKRKSFHFKVEELLAKFNEKYLTVVGQESQHLEQALMRLERLRPELIDMTTYAEIVQLLKSIYPQRVEELDESELRELFLERKEQTKIYNIHTKLGVFTYCTALLFLGSHVEKDPLYAWVKKYLEKPNNNSLEKSLILFHKGKSRIRKELHQIQKIKKVS